MRTAASVLTSACQAMVKPEPSFLTTRRTVWQLVRRALGTPRTVRKVTRDGEQQSSESRLADG